MTLAVKYTELAKQDLRKIRRYTVREWGKNQAVIYSEKLKSRINWLAKNPQAGTHRPDIRINSYSFPEGRHLIFYQIHGSILAVIAIPHGAMDYITHRNQAPLIIPNKL